MRQLALAGALAAAVVSTVACDDTDNPFAPSDIVGVTWNLTSVQIPGLDPIIVDEPGEYQLRFNENGTVDVDFDCASCSGTYTLDDDDLEIDDVVCTTAGCSIGSIDPQIAAALESVENVSVDLDDDEMTITGNGVTLQFER